MMGLVPLGAVVVLDREEVALDGVAWAAAAWAQVETASVHHVAPRCRISGVYHVAASSVRSAGS